jgi:signal transduction histidine kinase
MHRAVRASPAQLEQSNRELDAFARQLAHELRTPIGQVSAIAQLLLDGPAVRSDAQGREWLRMQLEAARRMECTLRDLLDLARSTLTPLHIEPVDLSALCTTLREELQDANAHARRRAPAHWHIDAGMQVRASHGVLAVAMRNLLSNALKYTRDIAEPVIHVSCRTEDGWTFVQVRDNGVGFDHKQADHLFEPFVRLCCDREYEGTGLGLSIVKRVVERHGGSIKAESVPYCGACFEMALPA